MLSLRFLLAAASLQAPAALLVSRGHGSAVDRNFHAAHTETVKATTFVDFVKKYNRAYTADTKEWTLRERNFNESKREALAFLDDMQTSWVVGITKFSDYTHDERNALLGWKGSKSPRSISAKMLEEFSNLGSLRMKVLQDTPSASWRQWSHPKEFSAVQPGLGSLGATIRNQGGCGSCWAHAATSVLEARMEANATIMKALRNRLDSAGRTSSDESLSVHAVTKCTANPRNCGGSGGCSGATTELAFDMIQDSGIPLDAEQSFSGQFDKSEAALCGEAARHEMLVSITGYEVLPSNKLHPLIQALYESGGPIGVSVDATTWFAYHGGILSDVGGTNTPGRFTINHAVVLVGYKMPRREDDGSLDTGYWHIKNSWGQNWGEDGFIRVEMKENEEEHCGMDKNTHVGLACDGDPDEAWVCGTCGMLYDTTYPTGVYLKEQTLEDAEGMVSGVMD